MDVIGKLRIAGEKVEGKMPRSRIKNLERGIFCLRELSIGFILLSVHIRPINLLV
jgi:hypothetical protein